MKWLLYVHYIVSTKNRRSAADEHVLNRRKWSLLLSLREGNLRTSLLHYIYFINVPKIDRESSHEGQNIYAFRCDKDCPYFVRRWCCVCLLCSVNASANALRLQLLYCCTLMQVRSNQSTALSHSKHTTVGYQLSILKRRE